MLKIAIAASALLLPSVAFADHDVPPRRGPDLGVGMHFGWYRPVGASESMGGLGVSVRHPIDNRVVFEASGTYFEETSPTGRDLRAYPIEASLLGYVWPRSPIQLYGIAGAGFEGTDVVENDRSQHFTRIGGHMGVGAQMNLGRLTFEADWRWILYARPEETSTHPFEDRDARLVRVGMTLFF